MFDRSQKETTFKIQCLPETTTAASFERAIGELAHRANPQRGEAWQFKVGLAIDTTAGERFRVGTVSCSSQYIKEKMMKTAKQDQANPNSTWRTAIITDDFSSLTILYSPLDMAYPHADICFVHGLDGNAIDSFAFERTIGNKKPPVVLWPRDLLPKDPSFKSARIMTYGYDSGLFHGKNQAGMRDWSSNLLLKIDEARDSPAHRGVPLILIGYSLGGLVVREALASLFKYPKSYQINADRCGAIFLGTPHSGSKTADWSKVLIALGSLFDLKPELVDHLKTFSPMLLESQRAWFEQQSDPSLKNIPYICFCETLESKVGLVDKMIVPNGSAGFMGQEAISLPETDHHSICKYGDLTDENFKTITTQLRRMMENIREALAMQDVGTPEMRRHKLPGECPPVSPYTPIRPVCFGVKRARNKSSFFGRVSELRTLVRMVDDDSLRSGGQILVTGIGGIGKTEIALRVARDKGPDSGVDRRPHVIFLDANNLEKDLETVAAEVGPEILLVTQEMESLEETWRTRSSTQRGDAFKLWLERSQDPKIILIDDAGIIPQGAIPDLELPVKAQSLVISTRNPQLLQRQSPRTLVLESMKPNEIMEGLKKALQQGMPDSDDRLRLVGESLGHHPLAIQHAMEIMLNRNFRRNENPAEHFLRLCCGPDHRARWRFLAMERDGKSILGCFTTSVDRLAGNHPLRKVLLNFAGFLNSSSQMKDFYTFFTEILGGANGDVLQGLSEQLPDFELLQLPNTPNGELCLEEYVSDLVSVSLLTRSQSGLQMHKLWVECVRHLAGETGRIRYVKQILLICDTILKKSPRQNTKETKVALLPFINACYEVLQDFSMSFDSVRSPHHHSRLSLESHMAFWRFQTNPTLASIRARKMKDYTRSLSALVEVQSLERLEADDIRLQDAAYQLKGIFLEMTQFFGMSAESLLSNNDLHDLRNTITQMGRLSFLETDSFYFLQTLADFEERVDKVLRAP